MWLQAIYGRPPVLYLRARLQWTQRGPFSTSSGKTHEDLLWILIQIVFFFHYGP